MKLRLSILFAFLLFSFNANAVEQNENEANNQYQSLDEIHELVENHIKQKVDQHIYEPTIRLRKLSSSLRLPSCENALQIIDNRLDKTAGRMTIRVKCNNPSWQVFVPVTVDGKKPIVVAAKAILKRAVITEDDVKQILVSYKRIPNGVILDINKAIGMRAKQPIAANDPIIVRDLQPPYWVFKDKDVIIVTHIGGIEVRTKGVALKSGVVDEQVPVKNASSEKIVNGIVIAPNTVLIP